MRSEREELTLSLGNSRFTVADESEPGEAMDREWMSGIKDVKGREWKGMEARLGRPPGSVGFRKRGLAG